MSSSKFLGYSKTHYYRLLRKYGSECHPSCDDETPDLYPLESDGDRELFDSLPQAGQLPDAIYREEVSEDTEEEYSDSEDETETPVFSSPAKDSNEEALDELRYIVAKCGLTTNATNLLLQFISKHSTLYLPKTYKTLMRTPQVSVVPLKIGESGQYVHVGIRNFFLNSKYDQISKLASINLDIGIDGISFFF